MPPSMPPIFCLDLLVDLLDGFVAGGHDHVLQHLDVARHFRIDLHARAGSCGRPSARVTMPPPAEASTRICAISCCSFSCICCACCIICCMLPGIFTLATPSDCELCGLRRRTLRGSAALPDWRARALVTSSSVGGGLAASGRPAPPAASPTITLMRSGRPQICRARPARDPLSLHASA